ncbi:MULTISPECIES: porin [unclassified Janthinobacterium]|uniref:porin n=1 Tax=unclassified Janthinobacterium TaxID=2610881 RepID=UPI00161DEF89|nr:MULTISPECIES: porin [unclassified Janthinobacterium]MBB5608139.1 putative porin [Janthinobacterium sp. S3T4]MBB5613465.1 putative porin [Janthinobacterium sp. S3M3]
MKKALLITLLGLGACNGALAQSNVTIYGVADAGLVLDKDAAGERLNRIASGVASGSRIGFKGREDLGGGLAASFVLENGYNIDTGTTGQGGLLFGRQAYVGLSGSAGAVTAGRQYSPYYLALRDVADPFAIGLAGTASNLMVSNLRVDNMLQYSTPTYHKLSADLAYGFGEAADSNVKNRSIGGAVHYIDGPLNLTLAHHRKDNVVANILATQQTRNTLLAARYDFKVLQVNFGYADNRALDQSKSNDLLLGFSAPFGRTKLVASYIRHNDKSVLNRDAQQWAIGAFYSLSKRSDLYTGYGHISNKNGATFTVGNATDNGTGNSGFNLGIRHTF